MLGHVALFDVRKAGAGCPPGGEKHLEWSRRSGGPPMRACHFVALRGWLNYRAVSEIWLSGGGEGRRRLADDMRPNWACRGLIC